MPAKKKRPPRKRHPPKKKNEKKASGKKKAIKPDLHRKGGDRTRSSSCLTSTREEDLFLLPVSFWKKNFAATSGGIG